MTTLTDQLGLLEAERDRIKSENESLKIRLAKQAGALDHSNGTIRYLEARIEKLTEFNTTVKHLLHSILGTRDTIVQQQADLAKAERAAEPQATQPMAEPVNPTPDTGMKSLMRRLRASEAPMNGQAA